MVKLRDAYKKAQEILKENGIEDFKSDAFFLIEGIYKIKRTELLSDREVDFEFLENALERRIKGEPCAYITGETEFMGLPFKVNKNVLIPRQDTENLIEFLLERTKKGARILDLCTGSGCIGISLKKYIENSNVTMVDVSEEAIAVAKENALLNNADVKVVKDDVLKPSYEYGNYDLIVSNPPYIEEEIVKTLDKTVKDYEPHLALDGGKDGLVFYRKIAKAFKKYLKSNGRLAFEIGFNQGETVKRILEENGYSDIEVIKDYNNNNRIVTGVTGGKNEGNI